MLYLFSGGSNTAGLGGFGGPYRLDSGHQVFQVPQWEKDAVPESVSVAVLLLVLIISENWSTEEWTYCDLHMHVQSGIDRRTFAHGAMSLLFVPIELFLIPNSIPRLV